MPTTYLPHGQELKLICHFELELTRTNNALDKSDISLLSDPSKRGQLGNQLYFYRYSKIIGAWKLGPLHGYGIVPAVGIDTEQIYDGIKEALHPKAKENALAKYRNDPAWKN